MEEVKLPDLPSREAAIEIREMVLNGVIEERLGSPTLISHPEIHFGYQTFEEGSYDDDEAWPIRAHHSVIRVSQSHVYSYRGNTVYKMGYPVNIWIVINDQDPFGLDVTLYSSDFPFFYEEETARYEVFVSLKEELPDYIVRGFAFEKIKFPPVQLVLSRLPPLPDPSG